MSKVTYIWGAGASYGSRRCNAEGEIIEFSRGLPVVNELERAIELLIPHTPSTRSIYIQHEAELQKLSLTQYEDVIERLILLQSACKSYPTIDTLAKQLYVTKGVYPSGRTQVDVDYDELKRSLSAAFIMMQDETKRDLRYDGFIASLIDEMRNFPKMTILSWNYDAQFEMAYAGYAENGEYIPYQWDELNVFNKMYPTRFHIDNNFALIKLNGTAFFTDAQAEKWEVDGQYFDRMIDYFYGGSGMTPYQYAYKCIFNPFCRSLLSYAWEDNNRTKLENIIQQRTYDTEEVIVIGYSFPYVNNEMDKFVLQNMGRLKKVVVQDVNFEDIKERIEGILEPTGRTVEIVHKKNLSQFYIPNRFE